MEGLVLNKAVQKSESIRRVSDGYGVLGMVKSARWIALSESLNRAFVFFTGTNPDDTFNIKNGNLTISDLASTAGGGDCSNYAIHLINWCEDVKL